MVWKNHKPPSGMPASGIPAGGEGQGTGKGDAKPFSDTHQPSGEEKSAGHAVAREIRERIAAKRHELVDRLLTLSEHGETDAIKLQATNAALDRLVGKPAQAIGGSDDLGPVKMVVTWEDEG